MAVVSSSADDAMFVRTVHDALMAEVRATLKEPLMKEAEQMVDAAVDSAAKALQPRIESWVNERFRTLDVNVLVNRVGEPPNKAT